MTEVFTNCFYLLCDELATRDSDLKGIILQYGYPPLWYRKPTFETLVHYILEQQVSLASAKAALLKLKHRTGYITPQNLLSLTDAELKNCYFSRQKIIYTRHLAHAILSKQLVLKDLVLQPDDVVKAQLKKIKGIGDWTADVFLMMSLHRCNCFPCGDLALVRSTIHIKKLPRHASRKDILLTAEAWQPLRSIASFLLWHAYIERKRIKA